MKEYISLDVSMKGTSVSIRRASERDLARQVRIWSQDHSGAHPQAGASRETRGVRDRTTVDMALSFSAHRGVAGNLHWSCFRCWRHSIGNTNWHAKRRYRSTLW